MDNMTKLKCTKSVEFMGTEVYTEGRVYAYEKDVQNEELKGYKVCGNGGVGYISVDDEIFNNFEEYKESYEIKAIYNGDINNLFASVFTYNGDEFVHVSDIHTEKERMISYSLEDVICDKDWSLFEVYEGTVKKLKRKNVESALDKFDELCK